MGYDTNRKYNLSSYINIFVAKPDILSKIIAQSMFIYNQDTQVYVDASQSYDPLGESISCKWDCPTWLGGPTCSSRCIF